MTLEAVHREAMLATYRVSFSVRSATRTSEPSQRLRDCGWNKGQAVTLSHECLSVLSKMS